MGIIRDGTLGAAREMAPMFSNTMTFTVALQIVRPLENGSAGTLIVLSMAVALGIIALSITKTFLIVQGWHVPPAAAPGDDSAATELKTAAGPVAALLVYLVGAAEKVMVQFQSVLIGTILVQEARLIHTLDTGWAIVYASFGVALGWAMLRALSLA